MTRRQRVNAVLGGAQPDRPPVSFWHHFGPTELRGKPAVDAHLRHYERFELDFLKVMNDTGFSRTEAGWYLQGVAGLSKIPEFNGRESEFEMEFAILRDLRAALGHEVPMIVTVFNSWASLRRLCAPESDHHGPPKMDWEDVRDKTVSAMLKEDRLAVKEALERLGRGLAKFSAHAIKEGADGVFLSVRDDWCDTPANGDGTYDSLVMPTDLEILDAVQDASFNMLHVCGKAIDFVRFGGYPAHILNWADRYAGPSITEAKGMTDKPLSGGVDNLGTLPNGTPEDVAAEVRDAVTQAGSRPLMITPGCTYDPNLVPEANLRAMLHAVRGAQPV